MKLVPFAVVLIALGACSTDPTLRYPVPAPASTEKIGISVGSVEVRDVNLPLYAELETISLEGAGGELTTDKNMLWADDPVRAVTQGLADALSGLTRAQVAAEPWPLSDSPAARVEVRFSRALAGADGQYRMSGQYFVAFPDGARRDVARRFDIAVPFAVASPAGVAAAQGQAIAELARKIAHDGL